VVDEAAQAGRLDEAPQVLEGLRRSLSGVSAYQAAWGLLYERRGDLDAALAAYERALAIDSMDQLSVQQKIVILKKQGRDTEARTYLGERFAAATSVSDMNRLAVVALRQGWPAEGEKLLSKVLESDPGNPGVLANLAAAQANQGKMAQAAETMRQAIRRDPGEAQNHFNLGAMLAAQGNSAEALRSFEEAERLGLRSPRLYVASAKVRLQTGDRPGAERDLRRAREIDPGDPEANELLSILQQGG